MVITSLFKEESAADSFLDEYGPETRIIWFWIHQTNRLTDGYVALNADGTSAIAINWSSRGNATDVASRAALDSAYRRSEGGMVEWSDSQLADLLAALGISHDGFSPATVFAETVLTPIRSMERSAAKQLCIQWDVENDDISDAISLRYLVVQKAEAVLNDAGLLVDPHGTLVAQDTVSVTLEVTEFEAAKSLLWTKLSTEERRYNCRIVNA